MIFGILLLIVGFFTGWLARGFVESDPGEVSWVCSRCLFEQSNDRMVCEKCGHKERIT